MSQEGQSALVTPAERTPAIRGAGRGPSAGDGIRMWRPALAGPQGLPTASDVRAGGWAPRAFDKGWSAIISASTGALILVTISKRWILILLKA